MKPVLSFGVTFQKKHGVSFVAVRMVGIVDNMLASNFLTSNCSQTYNRYI